MNKKDLDFAKSFPVLFSQVREDPHLDLHVLSLIPENQLKILMIGSGGCTLAGLAYDTNKISSIDAVDINSSQLDLCKLKLALSTKSTQSRAEILGHLPMQDRKYHLLAILKELNIPLKSFGDLDTVSKFGPDYVGRYEWLFRSFSRDFKKTKLVLYHSLILG